MLASSIPTKFPFPFANSAGSSFIRPVPVASQIGINPGAASDTDGFVPLNFLVPSAGGIPPDGRDVNGILNQMSAWDMWQSVGGPVYYDAVQSTAIGGYPKGALLNAVGFQAGYWWSEVDNNTSDPDTGGANWFFIQLGSSATYVAIVPQTDFYVNNVAGSDTTGDGLTTGTAWASVAHSTSTLATFNLNGNQVTLHLANTGVVYTTPASFMAPSNGTLVIQGDPSHQDIYFLAGASAANGGIVDIQGGSVNIIGLTIVNTAAQGTCLIAGSANVFLQNVTFLTSVGGSTALLEASTSSVITIGSGCIFAGNSTSMLQASFGGVIQQAANASHASSPAFTQTFLGDFGGIFTVTAAGFSWSGISGSVVTGARFSIFDGGGANTNSAGVNFFPGSSAGTVTSPGWYN